VAHGEAGATAESQPFIIVHQLRWMALRPGRRISIVVGVAGLRSFTGLSVVLQTVPQTGSSFRPSSFETLGDDLVERGLPLTWAILLPMQPKWFGLTYPCTPVPRMTIWSSP
jgi:hypothetical protein